MGFYHDQILPRIVDLACGVKAARPLRARVCEELHGRVLEIGFGSGHNIPFYPEAVTEVAAIEPSETAWKLARSRLDETPTPVLRSGLDGQSLPFPDDSFDSAVSTWTLCTIPDDLRALEEVRRVLEPGGELHFVEHGLAPDESVRRWQHRLEPIQKRLFGGCHLTRPIVERIAKAGFDVTEVDEFYDEGPKVLAAFSLGTAVAPGSG